MRDLGLANVQEPTDFAKVVPGVYTCVITKVEDVEEKEYLKVEYDIAEGILKNYYHDLFVSKSFWGGKFIKSYKEKALPFFKGFITAVEKSNGSYKWDNDESKLVGKKMVLVLGEEEYNKNDSTIGTRLYVHQVRSISETKPAEVPELKRLAGFKEAATTFTSIDNGLDELPF